jgi:hypothetical protein
MEPGGRMPALHGRRDARRYVSVEFRRFPSDNVDYLWTRD